MTQLKLADCYRLTETGLEITGDPSIEEHLAVGRRLSLYHRASGFWLVDWIAFGDSKPDWHERLEAELGEDMLSEKTLTDYRYFAKSVPPTSRLVGVSLTHHQCVMGLPEDEQRHLLERARDERLTRAEFRRVVRKHRRSKQLRGQATLLGDYRVIVVDPPFETQTISQLEKLPVGAHAQQDAALFVWAPTHVLSDACALVQTWGFEYKTSFVWDFVQPVPGSYNLVRHRLLLAAARGDGQPDHPATLPESILVARRTNVDGLSPREAYVMLAKLYDGPRLAWFESRDVPGWRSWQDTIEVERHDDVGAA